MLPRWDAAVLCPYQGSAFGECSLYGQYLIFWDEAGLASPHFSFWGKRCKLMAAKVYVGSIGSGFGYGAASRGEVRRRARDASSAARSHDAERTSGDAGAIGIDWAWNSRAG